MLTRTVTNESPRRKRAKTVAKTKLYSTRLRYDGVTRITRVSNYSFACVAGAGITIGAANWTGVFFTFTPNDWTLWGDIANSQTVAIPNAAEFSALWDRVMIEKVEVTLSYKGTDPINAAGANGAPRIWHSNDYTDGTTGNTLAQTQQMQGCKFAVLSGNLPPYTMVCKPKFQQVIYYTAVTSSYEPKRGLIASGVSVPHYGIRLATDVGNIMGAGQLEVSVKYYFKFTNVK